LLALGLSLSLVILSLGLKSEKAQRSQAPGSLPQKEKIPSNFKITQKNLE